MSDEHGESRISVVSAVVIVVLAIANAAFAAARIYDAVAASKGEAPYFSLLLPMWIQPEKRWAELAVLLAAPAISMLLPFLLLVLGAGRFVRRAEGLSRLWPPIALAMGFSLLATNVLFDHVPELSENRLRFLACPGAWMAIPSILVAAGTAGMIFGHGGRKLGLATKISLALGAACLIANAVTTYLICHATPSM
jgi:hypothetical protein